MLWQCPRHPRLFKRIVHHFKHGHRGLYGLEPAASTIMPAATCS
ncbi:MAG: hypothetical protein [Olavius algarvensis Delta 4 endosymbiont]|nr:MAG: hypothetical protein [Olavius algarvensis Delta 4 endosymbiont]